MFQSVLLVVIPRLHVLIKAFIQFLQIFYCGDTPGIIGSDGRST